MDLDLFVRETVAKSTQQQRFYHFTDRSNLPLIRTHGLIATSGLKSANLFANVKTGGDALSLQSDAAKGTDKFVCLCFRPNHPMVHVAMNDDRKLDPVYLEIDPERVTLTGLPAGPQSAPSLQRLVEAGLRAQLSMQSLVTGQMQVELDLRPETPARLIGAGAADVPELPAIPSDFEELRQQLVRTPIAETVAQAGRTLVAVEKLANRINAELDPLAASAQRTLDSATHTLVIAEASIQHLQEDATATLEELRALANDGHRQLDNRSRELSRVLVSADQALHSANTFMDSADNLVARRSPARTNLEAALRDLADTARALRGFSQTVERNPNALLLGRLGQ